MFTPTNKEPDMATATRIYLVQSKDGNSVRLVRAPNAAQALRHVANDFNVALASQDELVTAVGAGFKVEDAGATGDPT